MLDDFVDTVGRLLDIAWGSNWGEFTEEYTKFHDPENVTLPCVVVGLVSRKLNEKLSPLKKRHFETKPDPLYPNYFIEIWRKWFDCHLRFYCYDSTNRGARKLANKLEVFIDTYTGFFKERGLSELIFLGEEAPDLLSTNRGNISVRALNYLARVEEIMVVRGKVLEDVTYQIKSPSK